jgi:thiamine biosynthesis lipoprotein
VSAVPSRLGWLALCLALLGCSPPSPYQASDRAFDQPLVLTLHDLEAPRARAAAGEALSDLHFIEEVSHPWKPGPLGRTNQLLGMEAEFSANPSLLPMIRQAGRLASASDGYFNPALGKLRTLWGLHQDRPDNTAPPAEAAIREVLEQAPRMADIELEGIRMRGGNSALRIDFGPFAQGFAVDTAMLRLREAGITHARLQNGRLRAALLPQGQQSSDEKLDLGAAGEVTLRLLHGEALVRLDSATETYLDPRSGRPPQQRSVTVVIAPAAALAAAAAEALLHVPPDQEGELLQRMGVTHALRQRSGSAPLLTPAMAQRVAGTPLRAARLIPTPQ